MRIVRAVIAIILLSAGAALASVPSPLAWQQNTLSSSSQTLTVSFVFNDPTDLAVYDSKASPPVVLVLNSDYSVSGGAGSTGTITMIPGGTNSVQAGDVITIARNVPLTQTTNFLGGGPLTAAMIGNALDKLTMEVQQINEITGRSLKLQPDESMNTVLSKTARANNLILFGPTGQITLVPLPSGGGGVGSVTSVSVGGLAPLFTASTATSTTTPVTTFSLNTQSANTIFAGPASGSAAAPSFRALVASDIPSLSSTYQPLNADLTAISGLTSAANTIPYYTGSHAAALLSLSTSTSLGTSNTTVSTQGAVKGYVDTATALNLAKASNLSDVASASTAWTNLGGGSLGKQSSASVSITGGTITGAVVTGLAAPSNASDAATKAYADSLAGGITPRTSVAVATTANITLSGEQTIDGVLTSSSRVLVKNQSTTSQNGIYDSGAGAWTRSSDSNTAGTLAKNYYYFVSGGTTQGNSGWFIYTAPTVLGTDPVVFQQFSGLPASPTFTNITATANISNPNLLLTTNQINENATNADNGSVNINYNGYNGGTTKYRDFVVYDGKQNPLLTIDGSAAALAFNGAGQFNTLTMGGNSVLVASSSPTLTGNWTFAPSSGITLFNSPVTIQNTSAASQYLTVQSSATTWDAATKYSDGTNTVYSGMFGASGGGAGNWAVYNGGIRLAISNAGVTTFPTTTDATAYNSASVTLAGGLGTAGSIISNKYVTAQAFNQPTVLNPVAYGAVGDGSTNNDTAIAACVAAAAAKGSYVTIQFPAGNFHFTAAAGLGSLTSIPNLTIAGAGMGSTYLVNTDSNEMVLHVPYTASNFTLRDLTIQCTTSARTSGQHAVEIGEDAALGHTGNRLSGCTVSNVQIINSPQFALYLTQIDNLIVNNVKIVNSWADGVHASLCYHATLSNILVDTSDDDCIALDTCQHVSLGTFNVTADTSKGTTWGRGVTVLSGSDISIGPGTISTIKQDGLRIENSGGGDPTDVTVSGVQVVDAGINSGDGMYIHNTVDCTVTGCSIKDTNPNNTSTADGHGMSIADWQNLSIIGNHITQTKNYVGVTCRGIYVDASVSSPTSWDRLNIKGNVIAQLGSNNYESMYLVPNSAVTLNTVMVDGNDCQQVPTGNYIYIDYTGADVKVVLNVNTGSAVHWGGHGTSPTVTPNY